MPLREGRRGVCCVSVTGNDKWKKPSEVKSCSALIHLRKVDRVGAWTYVYLLYFTFYTQKYKT